MGQITILCIFFVSFVALVEGVCNGYYYKSCHKYTYQKERYTVSCGWWSRCNRYRLKKMSVYYQCAQRCPTVHGGHGSWGRWSSWDSCTKYCGGGSRTRYRGRSCNSPTPQNGGRYCIGSSIQPGSRSCNTQKCKIDGGWTEYTEWSKWTECSESCGDGRQNSTRSRSCTNPEPKFKGLPCAGEVTEERSQICKIKDCPVDGGWTEYTEWSKWTECSESCGDGRQNSTRSRSCTNPEPKFNGLPCAGEVTEERSQICKIKDCPAYCECSTVGDTHYKTFDGEWIHFMGSCKFELAKSQSATTCPFSVVVTNKAASETAQLPYKRTIDFTVKDYKISLLQNKNILVDGAKVHLPYSSLDKTFDIFISGRYARVQTNCGIIIEWDGAMNMELAVLDTYAKQMTGICGDCDGLKNDLKKKNGTDVKDDNNTFSMIGASFTLKEAGITCSAITEVPEVSDEVATIASSVEYCGHLVMKENGTSPFQKCLETKDISPDEEYNMCVTDVSLYYGKNINDLEKAVCNNLESFALQCEDKDVTVDWRNDELCPLKCGTNQIYSDHVSGCQANCVNPDGEKSCHLPFTEGCACKDGFILSGIVCVKVEDCGCSSKIGYIALGEEVVSADCKVTYKCVMSNGTAKVTEEASENCHDNAVCHQNADGESLCKCKEGFEGDGIIECKSEVKDCKHTKSGSTYKGKISKTTSGIVCQEWAKSKPHGHSFTTILAGDSNHCRNPDGYAKPWCYTMNEKKRWEYCSIPDCEIKECRTDSKGTTYNGQKNTTKSGIVCQAWGTSTPHKHSFEELADQKNYCRNPDDINKPWCYTIDPKKRWDYCDIPRCATEET